MNNELRKLQNILRYIVLKNSNSFYIIIYNSYKKIIFFLMWYNIQIF